MRNSHLQYSPTVQVQETRPPAYDPEELYGIMPTDTRTPYDVREVIARLVDGGDR